jgi:CubicO group peptidase (beta-lactamase class C family)
MPFHVIHSHFKQMFRDRHLFGFVAILVLSASPIATAESPDLSELDSYIEKAIEQWRVPGLAISIVKDDEVVLARGYGVRKIGEQTPVDERTLFAIGSTSKAFTVAALGMLVDEGKLNWDDHVQNVLPRFELFDPYVSREITIRDLLCHRSGLSRGDMLWYGSPFSRDEILHRVRFLEPSSSFRAKYGYQNIMYLAAGQLIPKVTDLTWDQFVKQRLFLPLGMATSNTSVTDIDEESNAASPHAVIEDKVTAIPWLNLDNVGPAGSINSNVAEMANWIRMNLNQGVFAKSRLVSSDVISEMQTPHMVIDLEEDRYHPDANFLNYGLAWTLCDYRGRKIVEHGGAIDGMRARVMLLPDEKLGVVVLANQEQSALPTAIAHRAVDLMLDTVQRDWSEDFWEIVQTKKAESEKEIEEIKEQRVPDTRPSLSVEKYAGVYTSQMYGEMNVTIDSEKLKLQFGPNLTGQLEHWHHDTFRLNYDVGWLDPRLVTFQLDANGHVATLEFPDLDEFAAEKSDKKP